MSDSVDNADEVVLSNLVEDFSSFKDYVREQERQGAVQQRAFDQLYDELRQYKNDFIFQAEKPLLLDLLLFFDSLSWFQESLAKKEMTGDVASDSFQYLIDEFLELLYRRDVLPLESSDRFDRETQKAIKVEYSSEPSKDWAVSRVVKRGFSRADKVLRAEEVVVTRFRNKPSEPDRGGDQ